MMMMQTTGLSRGNSCPESSWSVNTARLHLDIDVPPIKEHDVDVQDDLALELVAARNVGIVDPEHVNRRRWPEDDVELRIQRDARHEQLLISTKGRPNTAEKARSCQPVLARLIHCA